MSFEIYPVCMQFPHPGLGTAAPPPPPGGAGRAQRVQPLSDPGSPSAAARSSRGPQQQPQQPSQVMVPMQLQLPPEQQAGRFLPVGNVAPLPGYGHPMQILPGYAFIPAQPQLPVRAKFLSILGA
jgi:hypothetical protein